MKNTVMPIVTGALLGAFALAACSSSPEPLAGAPAATAPSAPATSSRSAPKPPSASAPSVVDAGGPAADGGGGDAAVPDDPCPALPIPATCNGRSVVYREFGPDAKGDGTFFTSQAPFRLGFTRAQGPMWIVKFQTESDTYLGSIDAYGDNSGGVAWISDKPCDPTFAIANKSAIYGVRGGGNMRFVVARNDADAQKVKADPNLFDPTVLKGGHCYYAAFENTQEYPTTLDVSFIENAPESCGNEQGCYYLAFDMGHRLHDFDGHTFGGKVLPGYTVGP